MGKKHAVLFIGFFALGLSACDLGSVAEDIIDDVNDDLAALADVKRMEIGVPLSVTQLGGSATAILASGGYRIEIFAGTTTEGTPAVTTNGVIAGLPDANSSVVPVDVTTLFGGAPPTITEVTLSLTIHVDIDNNGTLDDLEPNAVTTVVVLASSFTKQFDPDGTAYATYVLYNANAVNGDIVDYGNWGGQGSVDAPVEIVVGKPTEAATRQGQKSYLQFVAPNAGKYLIAGYDGRIGSPIAFDGLESTVEEGFVINDPNDQTAAGNALKTTVDLAEGESFKFAVLATDQGSAGVSSPKVVVLPMAAEGSSTANAYVDSVEYGTGAVEVYDFSQVITETVSSTCTSTTCHALETQYKRTKVGSELNDPQLVFGQADIEYTDAFRYLSHGGQFFSRTGECREAYGQYIPLQLTGTGEWYEDRDWGFVWCKVSSGGIEFEVVTHYDR